MPNAENCLLSYVQANQPFCSSFVSNSKNPHPTVDEIMYIRGCVITCSQRSVSTQVQINASHRHHALINKCFSEDH